MQPKDELFPKYAIDYFNQLLRQYMLVLEMMNPPGRPPETIAKLIADVEAHPEHASWADVFALETAYLYALPDDRLPGELALARNRLRDINPEGYALYASTVPPIDKMSPVQQRAELLNLAERIRYLYTFVPAREKSRNKLSVDAARWTLVAALSGFEIYAISQAVHTHIDAIFIVFFIGQIGGFLSVQQRLQSVGGGDPLFNELQLGAGWFSVVIIAPLMGSFFAVVLYLVLLGGLISGDVFPHFGPDQVSLKGGNTIMSFFENGVPTATSDWAKLMVWAFIAGFAERFVPNVLDRLTGVQTASAAAPPVTGTSAVSTPAANGAPDGTAAAAAAATGTPPAATLPVTPGSTP